MSMVNKTFSIGSRGPRLQSGICADGTPIELSLGLDSHGQSAIRFVCDLTCTTLSHSDLLLYLRNCGDLVVPSSWPSASVLDWLCDKHLIRAPTSARFKMWHGASFSALAPRCGKLYFNVEWLSPTELFEILSAYLSRDFLKKLNDCDLLRKHRCAYVGYDFVSNGVQRIKLYFRISEISPVQITREAAPISVKGGSEFWRRLTDTVLSNAFPGTGCHLSLGVSPQDDACEFKIYIPVAAWNFSSFEDVGSIFFPVLAQWGMPLKAYVPPGGVAAFDPTLLAFGIDERREFVSLYFKPSASMLSLS